MLKKWRAVTETLQKDAAEEIGIPTRELAKIEAGCALAKIDSETMSKLLNWLLTPEKGFDGTQATLPQLPTAP